MTTDNSEIRGKFCVDRRTLAIPDREIDLLFDMSFRQIWMSHFNFPANALSGYRQRQKSSAAGIPFI